MSLYESKIVMHPWTNWSEGFEAPRISGNIAEKRTVRRVYIPQASQMSNLLCGSYFNCDPAEDSNVCFVKQRMSKVARSCKRWTLSSYFKAFLSRTNLQVVFASSDRSGIDILMFYLNPLIRIPRVARFLDSGLIPRAFYSYCAHCCIIYSNCSRFRFLAVWLMHWRNALIK